MPVPSAMAPSESARTTVHGHGLTKGAVGPAYGVSAIPWGLLCGKRSSRKCRR